MSVGGDEDEEQGHLILPRLCLLPVFFRSRCILFLVLLSSLVTEGYNPYYMPPPMQGMQYGKPNYQVRVCWGG